MVQTPVPTTVAELLTVVTQTTGNIARHRQVMAQVAATARAAVPKPAPEGGETK